MKRKILLSLALTLCLAGCSTSAAHTVPLNSQEYAASLPYAASDMRGKHVGLVSNEDMRFELEQGLMDLSKQYFSPTSLTFRNHAFLDYDELDATDGSRGLLGTLRDNNPNGLNPGSGEQFDTGNGISVGPILVGDLYEIDYYSQNDLSGIAIGLLVADKAEVDGQDVEITPEAMYSYFQVTSTKLVAYLRERFNEVSRNTPILVAAYQMNTDPSDSSNGGYIYEGYFTGNTGKFTEISQEYLLTPSTRFISEFPELASEFAQFKSQVSQILPDDAYVTGKLRVENGAPVMLQIKVETFGKTAGEALAAIQSVNQDLSSFTSTDMAYKVTIFNGTEVCAMIERETGSAKTNVITIY